MMAEEYGHCENCHRPLTHGQVITPWEDALMHADCDRPYALDYKVGEEEPAPVVLLGNPMINIPLSKIAKP